MEHAQLQLLSEGPAPTCLSQNASGVVGFIITLMRGQGEFTAHATQGSRKVAKWRVSFLSQICCRLCPGVIGCGLILPGLG